MRELLSKLVNIDNCFETLLPRAVLIQGLQGTQLLKWMYLHNREESILAARDVLSGKIRSEASSTVGRRDTLVHSVFLHLLYPSIKIEEITSSREISALLSVQHSIRANRMRNSSYEEVSARILQLVQGSLAN